jgi:integrase/recombinase XerC
MSEVATSLYLNEIRKNQSPATVNRKIATFRNYAKSHGHVILAEYTRPKPGKQHPHPLPEGVNAIDRMAEKARTEDEQAIIALCGYCALRVSEARSISTHSIDLSTGSPVLRVVGKGDKTRRVPVGSKAWAILEPYYQRHMPADVHFILLSDSAARRAWNRLGARAELERRTSSHDGRATAATHMLNAGANVRTVQEILGHTSLNTTQIYLGTTMRNMKKAMEL